MEAEQNCAGGMKLKHVGRYFADSEREREGGESTHYYYIYHGRNLQF